MIAKHAWQQCRESGTWYCRTCPLEVNTMAETSNHDLENCPGGIYKAVPPPAEAPKPHEWVMTPDKNMCKNCDVVTHTIGQLQDAIDAGCTGERKPFPKPEDKVSHPKHYTSGSIECIDAIEAVVGQMNGTDAFYTAQVLKYLWRWPLKGGVEDLRKAKWYLERLIAKKEGKP